MESENDLRVSTGQSERCKNETKENSQHAIKVSCCTHYYLQKEKVELKRSFMYGCTSFLGKNLNDMALPIS